MRRIKSVQPSPAPGRRRTYQAPRLMAVRLRTRSQELNRFYGETGSTCTSHTHDSTIITGCE